MKNSLFGLWAVLALSVKSKNCSIPAPIAQTTNGTYYGNRNNHYGVESFLGMPFAQPPIGDFRLRTPQTVNESWTGLRNATEYGYACIGFGDDTLTVSDDQVDEDCLTINVVRPNGTAVNSELPVLVYIYGGGFFSGTSRDQRYNMTFLVQQSVEIGRPIVAVSFNYRVGPFGFLNSKAVVDSGNGNLGFRDQRLALHWIQENIAGFGGDPSRVTIWGESAGATSVSAQLLAYGGRDDNLFHGAIANSGALARASISETDPKVVEEQRWEDALTSTGCGSQSDPLQCLRTLPADEYYAALGISAGVVTDGDFVQQEPFRQFRNGDFVKVPYILGHNTDEGLLFGNTTMDTTGQFNESVAAMGFSPSDTEAIIALYPENSPDLSLQGLGPWPGIGSQYKRWGTLQGDLIFIAMTHFTFQTWAQLTDVPIYGYRSDLTGSGIPDYWGACHFFDNPWFFRNFDGAGYTNVSSPYLGPNPFAGLPPNSFSTASQLATMMISFVHTMDPNAYNTYPVKWPKFTLHDKNILVLDEKLPISLETGGVREKQWAFIAEKFKIGGVPWNHWG